MDKKYILFDLDGTLTDSYEGIINALKYSLSELGIEPVPETFRSVIGPPLNITYENVYGLKGEDVNLAIKIFREYYSERGKFENHLYPGIEDVLKTLYAHGKKLMLCTAKPEHMALQIVEHFGLSQYFCFMAGVTEDRVGEVAETDPNARRTKTDVIRYILKTNDIKDPENAVMVGDRYYDMTSAKEMSAQAMGVLYGYGTREELVKAGADYIAETVEDITKIIIEQ